LIRISHDGRIFLNISRTVTCLLVTRETVLFCFFVVSVCWFLVFVHSQVFYCAANRFLCMFCLCTCWHVSPVAGCFVLVTMTFWLIRARYFIVVLRVSIFGSSQVFLEDPLDFLVFIYCLTSNLRVPVAGNCFFWMFRLVCFCFYLCGLPMTGVYFSVGAANCLIMDVQPMYLLVCVTSYFVLVTMTFQITRARVFIFIVVLRSR